MRWVPDHKNNTHNVAPSWLLVLYKNPFDGELCAILHGSKYNRDKTARLTETHTLETRAAKIQLDALFLSNTDQKTYWKNTIKENKRWK